MKIILVTYATNAGSTADVAELVRKSLENKDIKAELKPVGEVHDLTGYDAVVVGAPMILGWHRAAGKFLKEHRAELLTKPFACFLTAMNVTQIRGSRVDGVPIQIDPGLVKPLQRPNRLSFKESYALPVNYVRPILKCTPRSKPVGVGLFGGYLNLRTLTWLQRLLVLIVIQAKPGNLQDERFIKGWANNLRGQFIKSWLNDSSQQLSR